VFIGRNLNEAQLREISGHVWFKDKKQVEFDRHWQGMLSIM